MLTLAERAQRAWINNDPAAADLAALAELDDMSGADYGRISELTDTIAAALAHARDETMTPEQRLAEVIATLTA